MRQPNGQANMDLSNFVIVKARLGDEVRKVAIQNFDITRDELMLMLQRIFKGQLSPNDTIGLKYRDEDEDLVTIADDQDLSFAISCHKTLRLTVTLNGVSPASAEGLEAEKLRAELGAIRDSANRLLDSLSLAEAKAAPALNGLPEYEPEPQPKPVKAEPPVGEFDPLQAQQQHQQSPPRPPVVPTTPTASVPPAKDSSQPPSVYGVGNERPDTPSSVASNRTDRTGTGPQLDASLSSSGGMLPPAAASQPPPPVQQENVATITPTLHQQVNAVGTAAPPNAYNGMPKPPTAAGYPPPTSMATSAPPPPPASASFGSPAPPPPQPGGYQPPPPPSAAASFGGPPPPASAAPPMGPTPPAPPSQPPQMAQQYGQHPQPPSSNNAYYGQSSGYPVPSAPAPAIPASAAMPAMPPVSMAPPPPHMATSVAPPTSYAPPPPPSAGGYGAPPMGPPPMGGGGPGGANPFARGPGAGYPRPSFYPQPQ